MAGFCTPAVSPIVGTAAAAAEVEADMGVVEGSRSGRRTVAHFRARADEFEGNVEPSASESVSPCTVHSPVMPTKNRPGGNPKQKGRLVAGSYRPRRLDPVRTELIHPL